MAAAGFTWIRAQIADSVVDGAKARKGRESWDDYLTRLIARDIEPAPTAAKTSVSTTTDDDMDSILTSAGVLPTTGGSR